MRYEKKKSQIWKLSSVNKGESYLYKNSNGKKMTQRATSTQGVNHWPFIHTLNIFAC